MSTLLPGTLLSETIEQYFAGEKNEMIVLLTVSVIFILSSIFLIRSGDLFARGLVLPLLFTVAVFGSTALSLLIRDAKHKAILMERIRNEEEFVRKAEKDRIEIVINKYPTYRYIYVAAVLIALGLFVFMKKPMGQGIASGLLIFAFVGYVVDHYSEQRAHWYLEQI